MVTTGDGRLLLEEAEKAKRKRLAKGMGLVEDVRPGQTD
jgi:hypothetical protein